ncbi:hypothetical protein D4B75_02060 [Escherichia coli]|nr:hypothetical protein [Escherichia coli]EGD8854979.1 hypothetical protein [Escherichia coli]EGE2969814.1 hypothetical protein [Escherichia coli]MLB91749.1 hypothetical protein [Escherichia coli]
MPHKAFFSLSLYGTSRNEVFDLANRDVCWEAICSLKRETRLNARNTEIKKPGHFFLQSDRVKIIFIF